MTYEVLSAGYSGSRLCRMGTSSLSPITNIPDNVIFYACGWKFNIFYTSDNKWYGYGENDYNQLGSFTGDNNEFSLLTELEHIVPKYFDCGDSFTAILTEDGKLYTMGYEYGRVPTERTPCDKISFIACGKKSLIAIPDGLGIYYWSSGKNQVEHECKNVKFIDAAAGEKSFLALSSDGKVYSWGSNSSCGQGPNFVSSIPKPVMVEGNPTITRVFLYRFTSFMLDSNNQLWASGCNQHGCAGLGPTISDTDMFIKLPSFTNQNIVNVAIGDHSAYVLTEQGRVFSTGHGNDYKLMQDHKDVLTTFQLCSVLKQKYICFIDAGCSHVIVASGLRGTLVHPILGLHSLSHYVKIYENIGDNYIIDVSRASFQKLGLYRHDKIHLASVGDAIIEGLTSTSELVVRLCDGNLKILNDKATDLMLSQISLLERKNSIYKHKQTRCGTFLYFDIDDSKLRRFGFRFNEVVKHDMFGVGRVFGVMGAKLWFKWEHDNGKLTTTESNNPMQIHNYIDIVKSERVTKKIYMDDFTINVEVSPCSFLKEYNLLPNDLVFDGFDYFFVIGEFTHFAILEYIAEKKYIKKLPTSLKLIRRESTQPVFSQFKALNNEYIDVDVSFNENDKIIPFDRIVTKLGFATYVGRYSGKYVVQFDDALILLCGVTVLDEVEHYRIIRRIGYNLIIDGFYVGLTNLDHETIIPGDILLYNDSMFLVTGIKNNNEYGLINLETKEQICCAIDVKNDDWDVIFRSGIDFLRTGKTLRNLECQFSVKLELFEGRRVKPGDKVITPKGEAIVMGILAEDVWFKHTNDNGSICFPPQTVYNQKLIKVGSRIGSNIV